MPSDLDLVTFWSRQLSEHALFLQLGLNPPDLQDQAAGLHSDWEGFRTQIPADPSPTDVTNAMDKAKQMAATLRAFTTKVYDLQISGTWEGWLFPSFVLHTRNELDYFVAALSGQTKNLAVRMSNELCTWLKFMAEHAAFAAHLLDPRERILIKQALALEEHLEDLENGCKAMAQGFLALSQNAGVLLDKYFTTSGIGLPGVQSVIHPALALHVVREGRMFLRTLQELQGQPVTAEIPE